MEKTNLLMEHHNRTVYGTFYRPREKESFPIVIFSHGYNGHETDFAQSAERFAKNGIGAICYTFSGGSTRCMDTFPTTEMTIFTEKEDLLCVIDEVLTWDCVDKSNIFLFGGSQGGLVSALAGEERADEIRGMILLFPAFCIDENWRERFPKREDIPEVVELWGMNLGKVFFESIHDFYVFEHIGNYSKPILLMHGDKDDIVALEYSKKAQTIYQNLKLELFAGEAHGFSEEGNDKMTEMSIEFLKQIYSNE